MMALLIITSTANDTKLRDSSSLITPSLPLSGKIMPLQADATVKELIFLSKKPSELTIDYYLRLFI